MQNNLEGKVTRLDDHRFPHQRERQQQVKEKLMDLATREPGSAPTAIVGLNILPTGSIEAVVFNVEPEHIVPALTAMRGLMVKMEAYLTTALSSRALLVAAIAVSLVVVDIVAEPALARLLK